MKKYDWVSKIKTNIFLLRIVGLWPKGDTYTRGPYMVYTAAMVIICLTGQTSFQVINLYFIRNDLTAVTGTIYILLTEILGVFKTYYVIKNMKMLKELLKTLETVTFQPKNYAQISAVDENVWIWSVIFNFLWSTAIGANVFFTVCPLVARHKFGEKNLPFLAWYPFDTTESPAYECTFIYQSVSVGLSAIAHMNIDGLLAALNVFVGSQFDILCDDLRNLHKLGDNQLFNFIKCVKHHKEILRLADQSNNFLNWLLFAQFTASTLTIAITMFQLTLVVPMSSEFYRLAIYGCGLNAQSLLYCWFGNELESKSSTIPYAVFECDWTNFSPVLKKHLLFFTLRAQKPVQLSALRLFYLSFNTFMKILKTSWSYFALLNQISS